MKTLSAADLKVLSANRDAALKWARHQDERGGRSLWGNGAPRLNNNGAVVPDPVHPGAVISRTLFDKLRKAPLSEFLRIRQAALSGVPSNEQDRRVKGSFYANGCTGIGDVMNLPQEIVDACIRHDFAYTVGPNIAARTKQDPASLRSEADDQLWNDIKAAGYRWTASAFWGVLRAAGGTNFTPTPEAGPEVSSIASGRNLG